MKLTSAILNILFIALLVTLFGCNHHPTTPPKVDTIGSLKPDTTAVMTLNKKITTLLNAHKTAAAEKVVDSAILKNGSDASLFYQKGFIYEYNNKFTKAITCYQKAEKLGFDKKTCEEEISFCKQMMSGKSH